MTIEDLEVIEKYRAEKPKLTTCIENSFDYMEIYHNQFALEKGKVFMGEAHKFLSHAAYMYYQHIFDGVSMLCDPRYQ